VDNFIYFERCIMNKLLLALLACMGVASALTSLMNYQYFWNGTTQYVVTRVGGTNVNQVPVVKESGVNTHWVAINQTESRIPMGVLPESAPGYWESF
jgi:hypothetical protein